MPFGCGAFFLLGGGRSSSRLGRKGAAGENFFAICLGCVTMGCGAGFL